VGIGATLVAAKRKEAVTMAIPEGKERVVITLTEEDIAWVDQMAERFRSTRSQIVAKCITDARDTIGMLDGLYLSPENVNMVLDKIYRMWSVMGLPFPSKAKKRKP
jgi:hypothetical protein